MADAVVSSQQAESHQHTGAFHSPKGEERKFTQPNSRIRSSTSHRGDSSPTDPKRKLNRSEVRTESKRLVGSVDLEIAAPVYPATWSDLNALLFESGFAVTEAQRAVITHLIARDVRQDGVKSPATEAYQVACQQLEARRVRAKPEQRVQAALRLNTGMVVCVASKAAADAYVKWRRDQWKKGPPWYKRPGVPLHHQGLKLTQSESGVHGSIRLLGTDAEGKRQAPIVVGLAACGGSAWATLRKLLDHEWEPRAARIVRDDDRRRWVLKLSYEYPMPERATGGHTLVLRRGLHRFLPMLIDDGTMPAPLDAGSSIITFKRGIDARKSQLRGHLPWQGRGARGHGKKRFYRSYERLGELESNYVLTWCRQQAAHVANTSIKYGCSRVLIEKFVESQPPIHPDPFVQKLLRRFPFCQLRDCVKHALVKVGVELVEVKSDHNAQRCPKCGNDDPAQHDRRARWFRCAKCEVGGGSDFIAMWNTLVDMGIDDAAVEHLAQKSAAIVKAAQRRQKVEIEDGI